MIRVAIVAKVRFYREGLARALPASPEIEVVGSADRFDRAVDLILGCTPDLALIDTAFPEAKLLVRNLSGEQPATRFVAIAVQETEENVLSWAEAGISGYVTLDSSIEELVQVVESTFKGELRCSPSVAAAMLRRLRRLVAEGADPTVRGCSELTARELEIVERLGRGWSNKRISKDLGISVATVKNHVHNILAKLNVGRRGEAAALLRRWRRPTPTRNRPRTDRAVAPIPRLS